MVQPTGGKLSLNKQCNLLCVSKSSVYITHEYSDCEVEMMNMMQEVYEEHPYYGARRISHHLKRMGYQIGKKRVKKYMEAMGIQAIYPKKKTSIGNKQHKKYPYLLRGMDIKKSNQVWSTDITYIKIPGGFVYLLCIIDWYSRKIIAWDVSTTMDEGFCISVLEKALSRAKPEYFNSDQGSQFTSEKFVGILEKAGVKVSMDGKGRYADNIRIERLWRTIKYEDVYMHSYKTPLDVYHGMSAYITKYNTKRLHSSVGYRTPNEAYLQGH